MIGFKMPTCCVGRDRSTSGSEPQPPLPNQNVKLGNVFFIKPLHLQVLELMQFKVTHLEIFG